MRDNIFKKNFYAYLLEIGLAVLFKTRYKFVVKNKPSKELRSIVLIGNHTSFIDWAFLQMGTSQKIHFFIEKEIYDKPLLKPFLSFFGALPVDSKSAKESFKKGIELLKAGGIVAIFPEGELTKTGKISEFKRGFEFLAQKSGAAVIPFYLDGLFGSRFSKSPSKQYKIRKVTLVFGETLEDIDTKTAQKSVLDLYSKI